MHKSKIIIFEGFWTITDVINHPNWLFVFGDNDVGLGKGGQAIIRGLSNTIGIPTKKYPSNHPLSFYTDKEYIQNTNKISHAIDKLIDKSKNYNRVVLPKDGFGTGLADLPNRAPKTYDYLVEAIEKLKNII
jgi:hypothetical protein